ncbi:MAG: phenylalanine--tRNA ligase subunit beta [Verrucomicrobia bacterium]|nr:phenylalanine--tRNA ligase subunit beta [Verrucomicrobiota bacterium]MCH8512146.1 phenylalanine--tRNA ligase subunit beta [Kiritimatiellia bacterium]
MLIPLSWLKDYIELHEDVDALRELLTFSGLEVEAVETHGSDFEQIVVAEITAISPHPNADKLTLCTIEDGSGVPQTVVCGAPNVRVGMKTIFAPVGVTLPNGLTLKKAKIRGVESLGMLCAEDELGLSKAHDGIMDLAADLSPGTPAVDVLGGPEIVFDLEVTPNRPDCLSVIGVARELAAITGRELKLPETPLREGRESTADRAKVRIDDPEACPRYTARVLTGAHVGPSPDWMQKRLRLCGIRPINNLVDITNYVMLETGQPLHAFDQSLLHGDTVIVRRAAEGEVMQTLDDKPRKLSAEHLVIADAGRAVAVAGVMGGADSEIRDNTTTVLLESAAFQSSRVRATAKSLGMHTDSSYRFARGCDMNNVEWVSRRAASLMQQHAGATPLKGVVDVWPGERSPVQVSCRWKKITDLIGVDIPVDTMRGYFHRLGLKDVESSDEGCTLEIPSFRDDLRREVDLIEEIARLNGLDKIPARDPIGRIVPTANDRPTRRLMNLWSRVAAMGFNEIMNYSLTAPESLNALDPNAAARQEHLPNPISQDQAVLRTSLIPQMAETLARNYARQNHELSLFEIGTIFLKAETGVEEQTRIAFGQLGPVHRPALDKQRPVSDTEAFYGLKGVVETFLKSEGVHEVTFIPLEDKSFAPGQAADILLGKTHLGRIGLLARELREDWKIHEPVALAEIILDVLPKRKTPVMKPVPTMPATARDTALILDRAVTHAEILACIQKAAPYELEDVQLFDVFEGKKLGENRKSMAYRFTYRNPKKTLTDKAVEKFHGKIEARLMQDLGAEIVGRG